jgi:hypothetical protein
MQIAGAYNATRDATTTLAGALFSFHEKKKKEGRSGAKSLNIRSCTLSSTKLN